MGKPLNLSTQKHVPSKACRRNMVNLVSWTFMFEWCIAILWSRMNNNKNKCYNDMKFTILFSLVNPCGRPKYLTRNILYLSLVATISTWMWIMAWCGDWQLWPRINQCHGSPVTYIEWQQGHAHPLHVEVVLSGGGSMAQEWGCLAWNPHDNIGRLKCNSLLLPTKVVRYGTCCDRLLFGLAFLIIQIWVLV